MSHKNKHSKEKNDNNGESFYLPSGENVNITILPGREMKLE